jgi:uncharacterized membrane protein
MTAAPDWTGFAAATAAFLATHVVPARPALRRVLRERLGARTYMTLYTVLSIAVFAWLIAAAGRAPHVWLWAFEPWQLWVPNAAMPAACLLAAYGTAAGSPFSLGGRDGARFDPERPGIAGITRHPLLWAVTLWAGAHIVPNGDVAHVILFGLFALFGLAGMAVLDARQRRQWGPELWAERTARTSFFPFAALLSGRWHGEGLRADPIRLAAALALYFALLLLHPLIIGVSPMPQL